MIGHLLKISVFLLPLVLAVPGDGGDSPPVQLTITGTWELQAELPAAGDQSAVSRKLSIPVPPSVASVTGEEYAQVPVFQPDGPIYRRGVPLRGLKAQEVTTPHLLDPASFSVWSAPGGTGEQFTRGQDYEVETTWGNFGRLAEGRIGSEQKVYVNYLHGQLRLDSIVLTPDHQLEYRVGTPVASSPLPPALQTGERLLANVWFPGVTDRLTDQNLFPVLESEYPEPATASSGATESRIPKTLAKLRSGEPLKILAWGDSVTDGGYLPDAGNNRWQVQFVKRLQARFPQARIELVTEAWGGRNTGSYLGVPPGEPHNYAETVLAVKPDLIISEFVNDAGLTPDAVEARYSRLLADFQNIGAEWIILTPHYTRPDWMGLTRETEIDDDPRPYVKGLRKFAARHNVALADASLRYGRLWRQGIPYSTLMSNSINHPNPQAMKIFGDALMPLFPEK